MSSLLSAAARRLEGKVALITGGASGIGEATARLFSRHGARVLIADVQDDLGAKVCKDLDPRTAAFVHCDVTKEADVANAVNAVVSQFGKLDVMFNNAGICRPLKSNILENDVDEFQKIIMVNLVGAFLGIKHAAKIMIPAKSGSIITTASVCSVVAGVASHAYTSSKHGVLGLTRNVAVDLGRYGIRVNCVSPYVVPTPLAKNVLGLDDEALAKVYSNLKGSGLEATDIADAALYLASDDSKYVSGLNLVVDGGFTVTNSGCGMFGDD